MVAEGEGRKDAATHRLSGRAPDNRLVHFAADSPRSDADSVRPGDMVERRDHLRRPAPPGRRRPGPLGAPHPRRRRLGAAYAGASAPAAPPSPSGSACPRSASPRRCRRLPPAAEAPSAARLVRRVDHTEPRSRSAERGATSGDRGTGGAGLPGLGGQEVADACGGAARAGEQLAPPQPDRPLPADSRVEVAVEVGVACLDRVVPEPAVELDDLPDVGVDDVSVERDRGTSRAPGGRGRQPVLDARRGSGSRARAPSRCRGRGRRGRRAGTSGAARGRASQVLDDARGRRPACRDRVGQDGDGVELTGLPRGHVDQCLLDPDALAVCRFHCTLSSTWASRCNR